MNMKQSEQGYDARSYFKLVLNKLKVMGRYFCLHSFGDLAQKSFHGSLHMPIIEATFLKTLLKC